MAQQLEAALLFCSQLGIAFERLEGMIPTMESREFFSVAALVRSDIQTSKEVLKFLMNEANGLSNEVAAVICADLTIKIFSVINALDKRAEEIESQSQPIH